ncbi:FxLYD domain-containing protein [Desulfovibrio oxyclinae]|uniref:FxLYD domain-containing protein n=1 Tax=Desulfovibrio oxyclinae TaxID=63560 RepID=UPI0003696592|nr:FxLYD domain-containing protein [Desulfovibrio oxyclinae]
MRIVGFLLLVAFFTFSLIAPQLFGDEPREATDASFSQQDHGQSKRTRFIENIGNELAAGKARLVRDTITQQYPDPKEYPEVHGVWQQESAERIRFLRKRIANTPSAKKRVDDLDELRFLLPEDKDVQKRWEQERAKLEKQLYRKARALPASDVLDNYLAYRELSRLFDKPLYAKKTQHYQKKLAEKRRREARIASSDLELLSWEWFTEGRYFHVNGRVKNISGRRLEYVKVLISFFNSNDEFITSDYSYLELTTLMPNQISPFKLMGRANPQMHTARIQFATRGVELQYYKK